MPVSLLGINHGSGESTVNTQILETQILKTQKLMNPGFLHVSLNRSIWTIWGRFTIHSEVFWGQDKDLILGMPVTMVILFNIMISSCVFVYLHYLVLLANVTNYFCNNSGIAFVVISSLRMFSYW